MSVTVMCVKDVSSVNVDTRVVVLDGRKVKPKEWRKGLLSQLAQALERAPNLRELVVRWARLDAAGAATIASAVREMSALEVLRLEHNDFGDAGATCFAEALQLKVHMRVLDMTACRLSGEGAAAVAGAMESMPELRVLRLGSNVIGDAGAVAVAERLRAVPVLGELEMSACAIGREGAEALAAALEGVPNLEVLGLRYNALGGKGGAAIARALRFVPRLRQLLLNKNNLRATGGLATAAHLRTLQQLEVLDLSHNAIGREAAAAIAACAVLMPDASILFNATPDMQEPTPMQARRILAGLRDKVKPPELEEPDQPVDTPLQDVLAEVSEVVSSVRADEASLNVFRQHVKPARDAIADVCDKLAECAATVAEANASQLDSPAAAAVNDTAAALEAAAASALEEARRATLTKESRAALLVVRRARVEALREAEGMVTEAQEARCTAVEKTRAEVQKLQKALAKKVDLDAPYVDGAPAAPTTADELRDYLELSTEALARIERLEGVARYCAAKLLDALRDLEQETARANACLAESLHLPEGVELATAVPRALYDNMGVQDGLLRTALDVPKATSKKQIAHLRELGQQAEFDMIDAGALPVLEEELLQKQSNLDKAEDTLEMKQLELKRLAKRSQLSPEERATRGAEVAELRHNVAELRVQFEELERNVALLAENGLPEAVQVLSFLRGKQHVPEVLQMLQSSGLVSVRDLEGDYMREEELELPQSRYQMRVVRPVGGDQVLKVLKAFPTDRFKMIRNEVVNVAGVEHPNVLRPELVFMDAGGALVWVQYPYVEQGSLDRWVAEVCVPQRLEGEELLSREGYEVMRGVFRELLDGVMHLHANGVVHNDLKPANVLMGEGDVPRICDFELSTQKNIVGTRALGSMTVRGLTVSYAAPEVMMNKRSTEKSDMYSLGRLMYDTMLHEWLAEEHAAPAAGVMQASLPPGFDPREKSWAFPENVHPLFRELVEWLLQEEQDARPSAEVARAHPFFTRVLFEEEVEVDLGAVLQLDLHAALEERKLWQGDGRAGAPRRVQLDLHDREAIEVATLFRERGCQRRKVVSIERVENGRLLQKFAFTQKHMREKNGGEVEEQLVFHGTKPHVVDGIAEQGFDMRLNGVNGTAYGKGNYFARDSSYSAGGTYSPADGAGVKWMFVARILVGETVRGNGAMRRPEREDGRLVDTAVDSVESPKIYVTFENGQAMPVYVIGFK